MLKISPKGWDFLDEHAKPSSMGNQTFMAMSFSQELESAWEKGFRLAIEKAGFVPYRVDQVPHTERIDAKIISEIKNSLFMVADVTNQRPGVYLKLASQSV